MLLGRAQGIYKIHIQSIIHIGFQLKPEIAQLKNLTLRQIELITLQITHSKRDVLNQNILHQLNIPFISIIQQNQLNKMTPPMALNPFTLSMLV